MFGFLRRREGWCLSYHATRVIFCLMELLGLHSIDSCGLWCPACLASACQGGTYSSIWRGLEICCFCVNGQCRKWFGLHEVFMSMEILLLILSAFRSALLPAQNATKGDSRSFAPPFPHQPHLMREGAQCTLLHLWPEPARSWWLGPDPTSNGQGAQSNSTTSMARTDPSMFALGRSLSEVQVALVLPLTCCNILHQRGQQLGEHSIHGHW